MRTQRIRHTVQLREERNNGHLAVALRRTNSRGDQSLLVREVLGNAFGLASALGGMRRKVWAWPVGILGNLLLLTVFLGALVGSPHPVTMLGQAGRQIMFIAVPFGAGIVGVQPAPPVVTLPKVPAVIPKWATNTERAGLVVAMVAGTLLLTPIFRALGSVRTGLVRRLDLHRFPTRHLRHGARLG